MSIESIYYAILEYFGNDKFKFTLFTTVFLYFYVAWGAMLFFSVIDYTKKPAFLYKYKIKDATTVSNFTLHN